MTTDHEDGAALAQQVAAAFGLGRPTGPLTPVERGAMGMVWRLDTDRGAFAAKSLFAWAGDSRVEIEAKVTDAAIAAGVQTPHLVRSPGGHIVETLDGQRWRIFSWMELGPPLQRPPSEGEATALGAGLAELHGLGLPADPSQIIPWFTGRRSEADWRGIEQRVRAAGPDWAPLLTNALQDIIELAATADPAGYEGNCVLSHCDLNPGNVWMGGARAVLLDWEHAGAIPPLWELGCVLQAWALGPGDAIHPQTARAIVAGYRAAGGAAGPLTLDIFAGAISAVLNWTVGRIYAARTAADPAERARAVSEATDLLAHPLTRARLEALLAAV